MFTLSFGLLGSSDFKGVIVVKQEKIKQLCFDHNLYNDNYCTKFTFTEQGTTIITTKEKQLKAQLTRALFLWTHLLTPVSLQACVIL